MSFCDLLGCSPIPVEFSAPQASPPTIMPSVVPTPSPTTPLMATPRPTTARSTPLPSASPLLPLPTAQPTPKPPLPNSTCDMQRGTLEGQLNLKWAEGSDPLALLAQTTVVAKSLDPLVPYVATVAVKEGRYRLIAWDGNNRYQKRLGPCQLFCRHLLLKPPR